MYGFGDASKAAFGATVQLEDRLLFQYGQWSSEIVKGQSSNWIVPLQPCRGGGFTGIQNIHVH
jgi:hypothetical protein